MIRKHSAGFAQHCC